MKKIVVLFSFLFLLSACSLNSEQPSYINEKNAGQALDNFNGQEIIERINAINKGLAPKIKPTGKKDSASPPEQPAPQQARIQLENLASQYGLAIIKTNFGEIKVGFYKNESSITINNFMNLVKKGFYNGTKFHRVVKDFMIQGGDPNSKDDDWDDDGLGGPGYQFQDEINSHQLVKGSLVMANSGPDTNGSQFFIVTASSTPWLDGKHTNFGYVTEGMEVVEKIEQVKTNENNHPIENVIVESIELVSDNQAAKINQPTATSSTETATSSNN